MRRKRPFCREAGRRSRRGWAVVYDNIIRLCGCFRLGCAFSSLRLAAQDVALSRRKQGFDSPRERHFVTPRRSQSGRRWDEPKGRLRYDMQANTQRAAGQKLVVGISSRALFNLDDSHRIYQDQGLEAYRQYQIENEDELLEPAGAFHLVRKLLNINELLGEQRIEVVLLSRNSADTGLRVFNSIEHHQLPIACAAFCGGASPHRYVDPFGVHLFLSSNAEDVRRALEQGVAAAKLLSSREFSDDGIRFAFDGDAVLFSDQAQRIYQEQGLQAFSQSEQAAAAEPLDGGPFKPFLSELHRLQQEFTQGPCPIRTALVTARSAPAHKRVINTLRHWGVRLDESLFLGGKDKAEFLRAYRADVFFDDQQHYCDSARSAVTTGHVPSTSALPR